MSLNSLVCFSPLRLVLAVAEVLLGDMLVLTARTTRTAYDADVA